MTDARRVGQSAAMAVPAGIMFPRDFGFTVDRPSPEQTNGMPPFMVINMPRFRRSPARRSTRPEPVGRKNGELGPKARISRERADQSVTEVLAGEVRLRLWSGLVKLQAENETRKKGNRTPKERPSPPYRTLAEKLGQPNESLVCPASVVYHIPTGTGCRAGSCQPGTR